MNTDTVRDIFKIGMKLLNISRKS